MEDRTEFLRKIQRAELTLTSISEQNLKYGTIVYIKITCFNRMYNKFDNN